MLKKSIIINAIEVIIVSVVFPIFSSPQIFFTLHTFARRKPPQFSSSKCHLIFKHICNFYSCINKLRINLIRYGKSIVFQSYYKFSIQKYLNMNGKNENATRLFRIE